MNNDNIGNNQNNEVYETYRKSYENEKEEQKVN